MNFCFAMQAGWFTTGRSYCTCKASGGSSGGEYASSSGAVATFKPVMMIGIALTAFAFVY
jgi:hypothetical protein